jgi:hypothetical protein
MDSALPDQPDGDVTSSPGGDGSVDGPGSGWDYTLPPTIRVSPSVLDFGTVGVGVSSAAQLVSVTVTGGGTVAFSPTIFGPGFALTASTCAHSQPANSACVLTVAFTPTTVGAASGILTVGDRTVALAGVGVGTGPLVTDRIDLDTLSLNQASPAVVTITPPQPMPTLTCESASPDLTFVSQTCPVAGLISGPCTVTFTFRAATLGSKSDSIICTGGGSTTLTLVVANVVALEPPVVRPSSGVFLADVGRTVVVTFTVSNVGSATAGPLMATISTGATDFSVVSNGCAVPIPSQTACTIEVQFAPVSAGSKVGILTVTDPTLPSVAASVPLSGTTIVSEPGRLVPSLADFRTIEVGQASQPTYFTLMNTGGTTFEALTITSSSPDFVVDVPSCPPVAPSAACTFTVTFAPSTIGASYANLVLATPNGVLVATATLKGEGVVRAAPASLSMTPPSLDFGTVALDVLSVTEFFTVTNLGSTTTGMLSVVKTGDPTSVGGASRFVVTTPCSDALPPGKSCVVSVTYYPTVGASASAEITVTDGTSSSTAHKVSGTSAVPGPAALNCNGSWSSSISFGSVLVGQTSAEIVCTTPDNGALDGGALAITATASGDFTVTSQGCTFSRCTVSLVFKPTAQGVRTGTLSVLLTQGSASSSSESRLAGSGR